MLLSAAAIAVSTSHMAAAVGCVVFGMASGAGDDPVHDHQGSQS